MTVDEKWVRETIARTRKRATIETWRAVEGQHAVSTMRLVDQDPERQDLLERILEESKPKWPRGAEGLHYLLATPFRYAPSARGSRYRDSLAAGVLYAAEERRTACAEMGYWRWRFLRDSRGLAEIPAAAQTLFRLGARGDAVDVGVRDWLIFEKAWRDVDDYSATQALARVARADGVELLGYRSVRDPEAGVCWVVFRPQALRPKAPTEMESWYLTVTKEKVIWQREGERFVFGFGDG